MIELLFSFEGRINRRPLWGFWLFVNAVNIAVAAIIYQRLAQAPLPAELTPEEMERFAHGFEWFNLFNLAVLWPSVAIAVKRAHDRDHSGWFALLFLIPLVNIWVMIEIALLAGTPGANRFGPDPLPAAKPGLGWFILLGHLIVISLAIMPIKTHAVAVDLVPTPRHDTPVAPQPNTQGLRPGNI